MMYLVPKEFAEELLHEIILLKLSVVGCFVVLFIIASVYVIEKVTKKDNEDDYYK